MARSPESKRELSESAKALLREVGGMPQVGPIETQVRVYIETLTDLDTLKASYAEIAYNLARKLDRDAGMATAAIGRELRELLGKIAETSHDPNNVFEHFGLPPSLRNTSQS